MVFTLVKLPNSLSIFVFPIEREYENGVESLGLCYCNVGFFFFGILVLLYWIRVQFAL